MAEEIHNHGWPHPQVKGETRCDCSAYLVVKLDKARGVWFVATFLDDHNHDLARPDEVPFLWSHRRTDDFQKAEILALSGKGI